MAVFMVVLLFHEVYPQSDTVSIRIYRNVRKGTVTYSPAAGSDPASRDSRSSWCVAEMPSKPPGIAYRASRHSQADKWSLADEGVIARSHYLAHEAVLVEPLGELRGGVPVEKLPDTLPVVGDVPLQGRAFQRHASLT